MSSGPELNRVLVIAAHPDDEVLGWVVARSLAMPMQAIRCRS